MEIVFVGNGGHASVLKDLILKKDLNLTHAFNCDLDYDAHVFPNAHLIVAIGANNIRKQIVKKIKHKFTTLIHPSAVIAHDVSIGEGTVILANAVIQSGVTIGKHCIVNANVVVDHNCIINNYCSIYPGAYLGSSVEITELKEIAPNQVISRNQKI